MIALGDTDYEMDDGHSMTQYVPDLAGVVEEHEPSIITLLLQRWPTALVVTLLALAATLSIIWLVIKPKYEVTASIHVAPVERHILFSDPTEDVAVNYHQYVGTEAASILSPVVVEAALNEPEVRTLPIVVDSVDPVQTIQDRVDVKQRQGTEWLDVTMTGNRPEQMVLIVNAMIDAYLRRRNDQQRANDERTLSSLRQEESELEAKLQIKARQLQQAAVADGLSSADASGAMLDNWMSEAQKLLAEAKKRQAIAEANYKSRQADLDGTVEKVDPAERDSVDFETFVAGNPELLQLKEDLRTIEMDKLDDARLGRGPDHPDVQSREDRIKLLKDRITTKTDELWGVFQTSRKQQLQRQIKDLKIEKDNAAVEVRVFKEELARLGSMRSDVANQLFELENLRHERKSLEDSLAQVREKIWTVDVEQNRAARVTLASEARVPAAPNKDSRLKFSAIACMLSVCLGLAAAILRARMDTCIREPEEVVERLGVRVLGSVERMKQLPARANGSVNYFNDQLAAPMRGISAALLARSAREGRRDLLITSPTPGSGKSSMAMNLARTLASSGRRVLLVDADNNRMGLTEQSKLTDKPGLMEWLAGEAKAPQIMHDTDLPDLKILPAGRHDPRFGELLNSRHLREKLEEVFKEFDEVIVDSPPVLASSDAVLLATLVDEVVLILRAGQSTQDQANAARQSLAAVGANVAGVILNAVDRHRSSYGYAYGYVPTAGGEEDEA